MEEEQFRLSVYDFLKITEPKYLRHMQKPKTMIVVINKKKQNEDGRDVVVTVMESVQLYL